MCGILAICGLCDAKRQRSLALKLSRRLRHRGPDWSGLFVSDNVIVAHERLAIMDVVSGAQPLYSTDESIVLAVNGEIYNYRDLQEDLSGTPFKTGSDCEVILHLYEKTRDLSFTNDLRGMYAFVIYDAQTDRYLAARDPVGIVPLYMGWGDSGAVWFASELKALCDHCQHFIQFPPGHTYDSRADGNHISEFYSPTWMCELPTGPLVLTQLRQALISSVKAHMMSDVTFGVLLSGGLDSSLIASIAMRCVSDSLLGVDRRELPDFARLRSFSVGLRDSPDLAAAERVAAFIGTRHYSFTFSIQDGLDALNDVIYHLETFDVTTVRASTPMYLMARLIKATGLKMVLSGEGADELLGGYLYFHKAPNAKEFHEETVRKIKALHMYDCLRANKAMAAFGVETRVPFLDRDFLQYIMSMDAKYKMTRDEATGEPRAEKYILRKAFDTPERPFLPNDVLWRQKEQFSDGVGYGWIDSLKQYAETHVSDAMFDSVKYRFPQNTPVSKEAYLYRQIFESHFPMPAARATVPEGPSIACSTPTAIAWDLSFSSMADPSGRAVKGIHNDAYQTEM